MKLFDMNLAKRDIQEYVGDISQIADAREGILTAGRADGVRTIDVSTGSGLEFTVLPTRGMDIAWAKYKGKALSFISKAGVSHPAYFEKDGLGFLRNFTCGLLTTCGLTYMGAPCADEGQQLGLHGRISNIPAFDLGVRKEWINDDYVMQISGKVRESSMFGENICLTRTITTKLGSSIINIHDAVENCGFEKQPLMLLYHLNMGYPLVSEDSRLIHSRAKVSGRDEAAVSGLKEYNTFQKPTSGYGEQVFYLDFYNQGKVFCALFNEKQKLGVCVRFDTAQFSHFGEWKMMGKSDYVVGLEPCTWKPEGRAKARELGELKYIEPGEIREFEFEISVIESESELYNIK